MLQRFEVLRCSAACFNKLYIKISHIAMELGEMPRHVCITAADQAAENLSLPRRMKLRLLEQ